MSRRLPTRLFLFERIAMAALCVGLSCERLAKLRVRGRVVAERLLLTFDFVLMGLFGMVVVGGSRSRVAKCIVLNGKGQLRRYTNWALCKRLFTRSAVGREEARSKSSIHLGATVHETSLQPPFRGNRLYQVSVALLLSWSAVATTIAQAMLVTGGEGMIPT